MAELNPGILIDIAELPLSPVLVVRTDDTEDSNLRKGFHCGSRNWLDDDRMIKRLNKLMRMVGMILHYLPSTETPDKLGVSENCMFINQSLVNRFDGKALQAK